MLIILGDKIMGIFDIISYVYSWIYWASQSQKPSWTQARPWSKSISTPVSLVLTSSVLDSALVDQRTLLR